jgi:hypothetical protein
MHIAVPLGICGFIGEDFCCQTRRTTQACRRKSRRTTLFDGKKTAKKAANAKRNCYNTNTPKQELYSPYGK